MSQDSFIPVANNAKSRNDLVERGFSRQPLRIDVDIARSLQALAHAAWSIPKDKYYDGGDRYRSLNRLRAEIVEGGVKVWSSEENKPYVQLKKYNTTLGGQQREYAPLPPAIAASRGVRKMIAHHLHYLPLSAVGTRYLVNVHLIRFTATPGRPCDTSPPGLHKDGEKYIATHLLGRCGARGGEVIITDNDKHEMDRFTMRECGECYVFDDDRICMGAVCSASHTCPISHQESEGRNGFDGAWRRSNRHALSASGTRTGANSHRPTERGTSQFTSQSRDAAVRNRGKCLKTWSRRSDLNR